MLGREVGQAELAEQGWSGEENISTREWDSGGINSERSRNKSPSPATAVGVAFPPPRNREILLFPRGVGSGTGLH